MMVTVSDTSTRIVPSSGCWHAGLAPSVPSSYRTRTDTPAGGAASIGCPGGRSKTWSMWYSMTRTLTVRPRQVTAAFQVPSASGRPERRSFHAEETRQAKCFPVSILATAAWLLGNPRSARSRSPGP